jgi:hypothetical protein
MCMPDVFPNMREHLKAEIKNICNCFKWYCMECPKLPQLKCGCHLIYWCHLSGESMCIVFFLSWGALSLQRRQKVGLVATYTTNRGTAPKMSFFKWSPNHSWVFYSTVIDVNMICRESYHCTLDTCTKNELWELSWQTQFLLYST